MGAPLSHTRRIGARCAPASFPCDSLRRTAGGAPAVGFGAMDQAGTIENPYANVTIPRAQLRDGFLKYYLGEDQTPDTVLFNPSTLPTYSASQEKAREADCGRWGGPRVQTQESWAMPYNPYASLKMPGGASPEPFHWKSHEAPTTSPEDGHCCCACCQKCCPCCSKCCCVVS